ncbi:MAG TPA: protein kinase [Gemmatimonadaceae bacterium]
MSDSRVTDQAIRQRFPYPIAAAWHRVSLVTGDAERTRLLVVCNEVIARTLAAFLLPDYLRGRAADAVEATLRKLNHPTDGIWIELVRETVRHLGQRDDPQPFLAEAPAWYFASTGKLADGGRDLEATVTLRNRQSHSGAPVGGTQVKQEFDETREATWRLLNGLGWLMGYRPFRVLSQRPNTRRRTGTGSGSEKYFAGKVQVFCGSEERTEPREAEWDAFLSPESMYLVGPKADGVLELRPFLEILPDPHTNDERLYLFRSCPDLKKVTRAHDEEAKTELSLPIRLQDSEVSFESWLRMRQEIDFAHKLEIARGALLLPREERLGASELGERYEVIEELGAGGMAIVYRVMDRDFQEEVAIKVLNRNLSSDDRYRERFVREARRMRTINHPRVVRAKELGTLPSSNQPFLKMPVMPHGSLQKKVVKGQGQPEELVRGWAEDALQALACIHGLDIVHRDVKPSNFLLDDADHACLADFGIAFTADERSLTGSLDKMGTTAYMAPELSTERATAKSDIYSLAVVLHQLRTGDLPRPNTTPGNGLTDALGKLIKSMGDVNPERRPTAAQALEKVRRLIELPSTPLLPPLPPPPPRPQNRPDEACRNPDSGVAPPPLPPPRLPPALPPLLLGAHTARRLKLAALGIMLGLFAFNFLETLVESKLRTRYGLGTQLEQVLGEAAHWLERELSFEQHDATSWVGVYGFSTVYFIIFPLMVLAATTAAFRRDDPRPLLLLATAVAVDYLLTLPFYVFFPVPERWTYPDSAAILLSDRWTSELIQQFRPFSGLNNCFPSFHVSTTVILVAWLYRSRLRFRALAVPLGLAVVLSTFALGIHWLSDIAAGAGCGLLSYALAERLLPRVVAVIASAPERHHQVFDTATPATRVR